MTFDSRSPEFKWSDVQIATSNLGVIKRIRGVKFTVKKEKEELYARGENPHALQSKNKSYEGELTFTQSVASQLRATLLPDEDLTDLDPFDITVSFVRKKSNKIETFILQGAEFLEDTMEIKQGDPFMEISAPIKFLGLKRA